MADEMRIESLFRSKYVTYVEITMKRDTTSKWEYFTENEILTWSSGQGWLGGLNAVEHNFEGNDEK